MSFSADGLWLHFQWNNTILLLSEQHKCFLLLYTCLSSLINSSLNLCLRLHFFEATVNEFFCYIKKFFSKKKKSPIPKYSTTNIDRVLSSCGFSYWSFFCLFSESLGFYSPLSGCISHSINAFRQSIPRFRRLWNSAIIGPLCLYLAHYRQICQMLSSSL